MYSGSITLIKHYSAIYLAIGGRDGMDCSGGHWMTCSIYKTPHQSRCLAVPPHCWGHWEPFIVANYVHLGTYSKSIPIPSPPVHQKRQEWVDGII